jgi:phage tail-like protein
LVDTLPGLYQDDPMVGAWLSALDEVLAPVFLTLDGFPAYLDPWLTPADFVPWLAGWVGLVLDPAWPMGRRRAGIARAAELYRLRGTAAGVAAAVELATGVSPEVTESGGSAWSPRPTLSFAAGADYAGPDPASGGPASASPASGGPASGGLASASPASGGPASGGPASGGLASASPASGGPASADPASADRASGGPTGVGPAAVGAPGAGPAGVGADAAPYLLVRLRVPAGATPDLNAARRAVDLSAPAHVPATVEIVPDATARSGS